MCTTEGGIFVYRNEVGTFVEDTASFGLDDYGRRTMEFADVNGDDQPDLAAVTRDHVQVHLNMDGTFADPEDGFADASFSEAVPDGNMLRSEMPTATATSTCMCSSDPSQPTQIRST